ncbi:O-antigen ligase family protein [Chitinibacteraceae bacterium HSL-7]
MIKSLDVLALLAAMLLLVIGPLAHVVTLRYVLLVLLLVWLVNGLWRERSAFALLPGWQGLAAFAALALGSLAWSVAPDATLDHLKQDVLIPSVVGLALYRLALVPGYACYLLCAMLAYTFVLAGISLYPTEVLFLDGNRGGAAWYYPGLGESSTVASYLFVAWVVALVVSRGAWRWLAVLGLLAAGYAGYASLNRGFWLAVIAAVPVFLLLYRPLGKRTIALLVAVCLVFAAVGYFASAARLATQNRAGEPVLMSTIAKDPRPRAWAIWLGEAREQLPLGSGFGRSTPTAHLSADEHARLHAIDPNTPWHSHNVLLNLVLQLGWPGLVLGFAAAYGCVRPAWRALHDPVARPIAAGLIALVACVLVKNSTDDFVNAVPGMMLMAYWALGMAVLRLRGRGGVGLEAVQA